MKKLFLRHLIITATALFSIGINATTTENMFRQVDFTESALMHKHELLFKHVSNGALDLARNVAVDLVDDISKDFEVDGVTYAKALTNAAILETHFGNLAAASVFLDKAVSLVEKTNPFHTDLFKILMASASIQTADKQFHVATDTLRHAQHIAQRQDGVYTKSQLPAVNTLAQIHMSLGFVGRADVEQRFNLKISEQAFGVNGEDLLPTLEKLGEYFAHRGNSIAKTDSAEERMYRDRLFKESISLYERSIAIIEDKYGADNLRLVDLLKGLSNARYMQGSLGKLTEEPMERATNLVSNNPSTDDSDIAKSLVSLADTYVLTSDSRAPKFYLQAWEILSKDPQYEELRHDLFGRPKRLLPQHPIQPKLARFPTKAQPGEELFIDLEYDVRQNGRVRNVKVIESNIPNEDKKYFKDVVAGMRFRPRIVAGELAKTEGLSLYQTFEVLGGVQQELAVSDEMPALD